jgi:hypothetical protein
MPFFFVSEEPFILRNQDADRVGHFPDFIGINEIIREPTIERHRSNGIESGLTASQKNAGYVLP